MILDEILYTYEPPTKDSLNILPKKVECLPESMLKHIRFDEAVAPLYHRIRVDSKHLDTISALDSILYSFPNPLCHKQRDVAATDDEVDNLPFYFNNFRTISIDDDFNAEITKPSCHYRSCPEGILSLPITLKSKHCFESDMVELLLSNVPDAYYLVSNRFKLLFEENSITGIEYMKCNLSNALRSKFPDGGASWLARVTGSCNLYAERIELKRWICPEHKYVSQLKYYNGLRLRTADIPEIDCATIRGITTPNGIFSTLRGQTIFSQKVWSLLLRNKARKLGVITIPFKSHLSPVLPLDYPI